LAKNLKLNIKNAQIANAVNLSGLKDKLASQKATQAEEAPPKEPAVKKTATKSTAKSGATKPVKAKTSKIETPVVEPTNQEPKEETVRVKARSRSAFAEPSSKEETPRTIEEKPHRIQEEETAKEDSGIKDEEAKEESQIPSPSGRKKTSEELRKEIFAEEIEAQQRQQTTPNKNILVEPQAAEEVVPAASQTPPKETITAQPPIQEQRKPAPPLPTPANRPQRELPKKEAVKLQLPQRSAVREFAPPAHKLGPTGRHVNDLLPPPPKKNQPQAVSSSTSSKYTENTEDQSRPKPKSRDADPLVSTSEDKKGPGKLGKLKEFRDIKPSIKRTEQVRFDARDKQGLRDNDEDGRHRKRRVKQSRQQVEDVTIRPTNLKLRIPVALKDLAAEMKLKSSQLIAKLFAQGVIVTLNDILEDATTIQLLGHEFGCDIQIDTSEEERVRITDKTIKEEIAAEDPATLVIRPPVVAFMGHVDHGKTSLIDAIRKSNRASGEAGAITQHIGAFRCSTAVGDIAILDTPGHEAFSAMRARGADVTDIVVLVVAGDEGIRQQTIEAIEHAKTANVTIVVAINKCDKPNFNTENVYRQLSEHELLPEAWGGQTITINCSAVTGEGIQQLLEMLALQAEILELRSSPAMRARGTVLESEMHKGMGSVATVLVQNGTLHCGDALVFGQLWGRVKTMRDEFNKEIETAGPSTPVAITGLSGLPEAGEEFIVVKNEKEARAIAEARMLGARQTNLLQTKKLSMDNLMLQAAATNKKILNLVLRADVQGSLEALRTALMKIVSTKAEINIIFSGVGEISESDVQLAATSKAVIVGFHTQIESHADALLKELGVQVRLHNIIYHAVDDVKELLCGLLDKIAQETEKGKAEVRAIFKSSQHGNIVGCIVTEGAIHRSNSIRVKRDKEVVWNGGISSLKRVKEDVKEVAKGLECGIVLNGFNGALEGDILEAYEITYITQEL